ncbi:type VI secretion protein ImpB [Alkalicaulis satelles]|uniref:DNA-directed DNA polymerase n=1 Tax=Alkalicaulis satelles TaxID=2609175 RepID=A0A5M6ZLF5_9PROT|nr:type VI secretion protein ImpB [Alkalicaulis satelles]KAA5804574.1 type VI secretion protein ImpB [Alkalicaulis satelles]
MRKPDAIEWLYIDFDGFFAGVEQQADRRLRGRPVGVVPFEETERSICIAVSKEAKAAGVKTGTPCTQARQLCPDIAFVQQKPDLYVRAHHALLEAIERCAPIEGACSIDELAAPVEPCWRGDPAALGRAIKREMAAVAPVITGSIGFAPNAHLAKIICKWNKPDGITILHPGDMPGRLLQERLEDIPGLGARMVARLERAGITDMTALWNSQPKQLRAIWGSVAGERFWYVLHGYDVPGQASRRAMFGHGRVLPPSHRTLAQAQDYSTFLLIKAARRMRAEGYAAGRLDIWLSLKDRSWGDGLPLRPAAHDDRTCLKRLDQLWRQAHDVLPARSRPVRVGVFLSDLWKGERQLDLFAREERDQARWETIAEAIDRLNQKYHRTVVSVGPLRPPPGQYAGGKIAYTRIPDFRDFT